jgi:hypothetical protein
VAQAALAAPVVCSGATVAPVGPAVPAATELPVQAEAAERVDFFWVPAVRAAPAERES